MTYITIDLRSKQAKQFLEFAETLPYATVHKGPNPTTLKAMQEVREGKTIKAKNVTELLARLKQ